MFNLLLYHILDQQGCVRIILCERVDSLKALGSEAGYLENCVFILINDTIFIVTGPIYLIRGRFQTLKQKSRLSASIIGKQASPAHNDAGSAQVCARKPDPVRYSLTHRVEFC
jgi:hypothetical protein